MFIVDSRLSYLLPGHVFDSDSIVLTFDTSRYCSRLCFYRRVQNLMVSPRKKHFSVSHKVCGEISSSAFISMKSLITCLICVRWLTSYKITAIHFLIPISSFVCFSRKA